ncbi:MAG TPA: response regulator [Ktedonobacterales bacterium]|nr:response regulator [Ktedonobacterales bacterium]
MSDSFDKSAILDSFVEEVSSYLPEIEANLDRLQQNPGEMQLIEETYRRTHTIAGSAAMMDFGGLSRVAQGMEDVLGDAVDRQAGLDAPSVALLRRSCARLGRLADQIRTGADPAVIVAEDEADRAASRGSGALGSAGTAAAAPGSGSQPGAGLSASAPGSGAPYMPTATTGAPLPDWLAAFAQPTAQTAPPTPGSASPPAGLANTPALGTDPWAASVSNLPTGRGPAVVPPGAESSAHDPFARSQAGAPSRDPFGASSAGTEPTFDEMIQAFKVNAAEQDGSAWPTGPQPRMPMPTPAPPRSPASGPFGPTQPPALSMPSARGDISQATTNQVPILPPAAPPTPPARSVPSASSTPLAARQTGGPRPVALEELRTDVEALDRQIASLADSAVAMRQAAQAMEDERGELRGFLDGSRDALDRLEDWTGRQMGLDLRGSPESVRRYLPLSVVWVLTTRLKSLVTLLNNTGRGVTVKQEGLAEGLRELRSAVESVGAIYRGLAASGNPPVNGFSATVAQVTWAPPASAPAPTAPTAPPAPPAAPRALSPAQRAELERDVREQLRRELEDEVRSEVAAEVRRDEENRLRQELQIQVRREILTQFQRSSGVVAASREAGSVLPIMPSSAERAPKPQRVTSDMSPEAVEVFRDEAQEHLQSITTGLAQLEANPADSGALQSVRRAMHTLKGAAGMMGFSVIQQLAHASEDLLDRLIEGSGSLSADALGVLLDTAETLDQLTSSQADPSTQPPSMAGLLAGYARLTGGASPAAALLAPREAITIDAGDDAEEAPAPSTGDLSVRLQLSKLDDLVNLFGELLVSRSSLEERIERLGRMVSDTVVVSERLREVGSQLETRFEAATLPAGRGANGLAGGRGQAPGVPWGNRPLSPLNGGRHPGEAPHAAEFDELELDRYTEFHRLSRGLSEAVADAVGLSHEMETLVRETQTSFLRENRLTSDFQDRLLKARLVPLQTLVPRLYRSARATGLREGKEIEFFSEGTDTEVDRKVAEEVAGPLLHIVRNAASHAIERPDERERQGKPRAGTITISASYEGNQVVIAVRDDGTGIDPDKIRATAVARGWIDSYTQLSDRDAINLIFRPGLSTATTVTEESGRGVGLDVVRDVVTRLKGIIEVDSVVGQGTTFTMKFPISLQIARAVLVRVGSQTLAIPMAVVDQIGRLDYYERSDEGPTPAIEVRGERYPLAHLASYLRLPPGPVDERSSVLLVNAGKRRVALLVDAIVAQQEVVSKPLGPHLRDVPGVAGAAVLGNGQVVLILELLELLAQPVHDTVMLPPPGVRSAASSSQPQLGATPFAPPTPMDGWSGSYSVPGGASSAARRDFVVAPRATGSPFSQSFSPATAGYLLVVDDSPSVRRVVSSMLKAHGWEVQTARDGVEALDVIARQMPAAVLLDIEMPRMDGYELLATVRSQEQYRALPLIVLTSRAATKHQQRAIQLGADAYVVKPYQDEELLNTIATLIQARRA